MERYGLADGGAVYHFDTGPFNWYIIEQNARLTLIDAGFPGHYRIFRRGLATLGRTVEDVAAIILTHAHADHMGIAERVRRESGAPVYIHAADKAAAQQPRVLPVKRVAALHAPNAAARHGEWRVLAAAD